MGNHVSTGLEAYAKSSMAETKSGRFVEPMIFTCPRKASFGAGEVIVTADASWAAINKINTGKKTRTFFMSRTYKFNTKRREGQISSIIHESTECRSILQRFEVW
jgi:hypothetical protein